MANKRVIKLVALIISLFLLIVFLVINGKRVINIGIPFFIAVAIMYVMKPILRQMEKINIPDKYGILILYIIFLSLVGGIVVFILPKFADNTKRLIMKMPEITLNYQSKFYKFIDGLRIDAWPKEIKDIAREKIKIGSKNLQEFLVLNLKNVLLSMLRLFTKFFDLVLGMIIAYYFITDEKEFKGMVLAITPKRFRNDVGVVGRRISSILSSFVIGQILTSFIVGILMALGLLVIGIDYALPLGLIGGIANMVPYFGPIIGGIPAVLVALLDSPIKAMWVFLLIIFIQQVDNIIISPRIIEDKLGLHPVTTILSVLIGGEFFGIFGMFFGVLITAILKVLCNRVIERIV